ncbi:hypothetical protein LZ554_003309 [Drepanopeziza brunnea f. sp. 'monogermtubi']|nr:hypothetical protein LZ554_003309 [Drepanopeziza brunnea f. sp. 'monogermtubi']
MNLGSVPSWRNFNTISVFPGQVGYYAFGSLASGMCHLEQQRLDPQNVFSWLKNPSRCTGTTEIRHEAELERALFECNGLAPGCGTNPFVASVLKRENDDLEKLKKENEILKGDSEEYGEKWLKCMEDTKGAKEKYKAKLEKQTSEFEKRMKPSGACESLNRR